MKYSEDQLRAFTNTIPTPAWSSALDGCADFFNQAWLDYTGLSADQSLEWGWKGAIHPDDLPRILGAFQEAVNSEQPFEVEGRFRRNDGEFRWFLVRGSPLRDAAGKVVRWCGTNTDIDELKRAEEALRESERSFRLIVDGIAGLVSIMTPEGEVEFVNNQALEYFGKTVEELKGWTTSDAVHPHDLPKAVAAWRHSVETGAPYDVDHRLRRADGTYRWFHSRGLSLRDNKGRIVRWYILLTDIDERKQAEEKLRRSEAYLAEAQQLSRTGSFGWSVSTGQIVWSRETFRIFEYDPSAKITIELIVQRTHPEDRSAVQQLIERVSRERKEWDFEHRLLMPDGSLKYVRVMGHPSPGESGRFEFVGAVTDVTERKRAEEELRRSENYLAQAQRLTHTGSWVWQVAGRDPVHLSEEWYRIFGFDPAEGMPSWEKRLQRVHPADRSKWQDAIERAIREKSEYDTEYRILLPDGTVKWIHAVGHPAFNSSGDLVQFVGSSMDITERKHAGQALRRNEADLLEAQRLSHTGSFRHEISTGRVIVSPEVYRIYGITAEDDASNTEFFFSRFHPEDRNRVVELFERSESQKIEFQVDNRIVLPDGTIKHLHSLGHPVLNESGDLVEYVGTTMDVTEHVQARIKLEKALEEIKRLKDQLHDENLVLRQQIDQAFMFEEIVGSSAALQTVLSSIVKVAPTDSTVLVTGETGTGKELIARAIHKRSRRSGKAFVSVNCASIPSSLIASELFGHEKGAFTGALQQRQGRFELAHSGSIFLDEVGELPAETQIALLRVLQERQFERVGGNRLIPADVRVIAATNRDLSAAIAAGTFRADLFYRLNVFPIQVPPLRKRKEDIPMLVEYFVGRFAEKMGKHVRTIDKKTLNLCQSYDWPGNIRELQNIIERSVILASSDTFSIDESWLSTEKRPGPQFAGPLKETLLEQEQNIIEAALAASKGKIAGLDGAAARLGIPPSTLDSKIKQFKIKRAQFLTGS